MNLGQYIFVQITRFLPKRKFERFVEKYNDRTRGWILSHWSQLLVLMFGQLLGCRSLRELTDITMAHAKKSFFLGFGKTPVNRPTLSKANSVRDYRIFEEFAFHMVGIAQKNDLLRILNCMVDSMQLTPLPSDSVCPFLNGRSFVPPSRV